jgi:hypothetical protein
MHGSDDMADNRTRLRSTSQANWPVVGLGFARPTGTVLSPIGVSLNNSLLVIPAQAGIQ